MPPDLDLLSRIYFHGCKDFQAIEVLLYLQYIRICLIIDLFIRAQDYSFLEVKVNLTLRYDFKVMFYSCILIIITSSQLMNLIRMYPVY